MKYPHDYTTWRRGTNAGRDGVIAVCPTCERKGAVRLTVWDEVSPREIAIIHVVHRWKDGLGGMCEITDSHFVKIEGQPAMQEALRLARPAAQHYSEEQLAHVRARVTFWSEMRDRWRAESGREYIAMAVRAVNLLARWKNLLATMEEVNALAPGEPAPVEESAAHAAVLAHLDTYRGYSLHALTQRAPAGRLRATPVDGARADQPG